MQRLILANTLVLPSDIFLLKNDSFYSYVSEAVGEIPASYLKFLSINSADCLLRIDDIFAFISIDSPEFNDLRSKLAFQLNNGTFVVRPGFKHILNNFIQILRDKQKNDSSRTNDEQQKEEIFKIVQKHSLLRSLISFYQVNNTNDFTISFLCCLIENTIDNLMRSKNHYHYAKPIIDFSISLYILGGRTTYEFVRSNLICALPKSEFRFESLSETFNSRQITHVFASEDCTGVVKAIKYDVQTDCFIGFVSPLQEGVPHCDGKYLRSMKLLLGFFATLPNTNLTNDDKCFQIDIPDEWNWFFLRRKQLLLFFQDATHLATKWRNRLLSDIADLTVGNKKANMFHLEHIVKTYNSKFDHALVMSDLNPSDRQNYRSCEKISRDEILAILESDDDTYATFLYIKLLRYIIDAFINKATSIQDRLYFAWTIVFVCRLWRTWLNLEFKSSTQKIHEGSLPLESLQIPLFSNQSCENFLHRAEKLTVLQNIKALEDQTQHYQLQFPKHHKHKKNNEKIVVFNQSLNVTEIETIVLQAFAHAKELVSKLDINILLEEYNLLELEALSVETYNSLKKSNRVIDSATSNTFTDSDSDNDDNDNFNNNDDNDDFNSIDDNDDFNNNDDNDDFNSIDDNDDFNNNDDNDDFNSIDDNDENQYGISMINDDDDIPDNILQSNRTDFSGMRVFDSIDQAQKTHILMLKLMAKKNFYINKRHVGI
ncbi:unnamed protein product [Rotaria sordida]|uniref:Uncharacterized protein n=1 Tax=Rotaria sordida TaxID=392033 RepID=A0A819LNM4_9BILA|nr:unnamed protein product [Rotaria sordida]